MWIDDERVAQGQGLVAVDQARVDRVEQVAVERRRRAVIGHEVAREDGLARRNGLVQTADPLILTLRVRRGIGNVTELVRGRGCRQNICNVQSNFAVQRGRNGGRAVCGGVKHKPGTEQADVRRVRDGSAVAGGRSVGSVRRKLTKGAGTGAGRGEVGGPVARKLIRRGDHGRIALRDAQRGALVAAEEKQLVVQNGSANVGSVLIPLERVDPAGDAVARVGVVVAEELEHAAVELIRPRFGDDVDRAAGVETVLRREPGGLHRELLQGVGERKWQVGVEGRIVVVAAVQQEVELVRLAAGDGDRDGAADGIDADGAVAGRGGHVARDGRRGAA